MVGGGGEGSARGGRDRARAHRRLRTHPATGGRAGSRATGELGAETRADRAAKSTVGRRNPSSRSAVTAVQSRVQPNQARVNAVPQSTRAAKLGSPRRTRLRGFEGRGGAGRPAAPSGDQAQRPGPLWAAADTAVPGPAAVCVRPCMEARARRGVGPSVRPGVRGAWAWAGVRDSRARASGAGVSGWEALRGL